MIAPHTMQTLTVSTPVPQRQKTVAIRQALLEVGTRRWLMGLLVPLLMVAATALMGAYLTPAGSAPTSRSSTILAPLPAPNAGNAAWARYYQSRIPDMSSGAMMTRSTPDAGFMNARPAPAPAPTPSAQPQPVSTPSAP